MREEIKKEKLKRKHTKFDDTAAIIVNLCQLAVFSAIF
jgi:hypothetical protein